MRIMHVISGGDVGGAKTHVLSLLRGLSQRHEVTLVCFMDGDFAKEAREKGIHTMILPGTKLIHDRNLLAKKINEEKFDVVHCHGAKGNSVGYLLKNKIKVPVLSTVHSDPRLDYMGRFFGNLVYGTINRFSLRHMSFWVSVSDATKQMLVDRGFDASRIYPIYNGVDFNEFGPVTERPEFLKQLGLSWDENQVIFGIAARISPVKDMKTLITAFSKVASKVPQAKLLIAGDGEQRAEMEELAANLCPKGSYHFAGWLKGTESFYHALDVNLLTSLSETFPYAISEGARMHCATIATTVGGVPRMVVDGETGYLIQPGDAETLADRMERVATDRELRLKLGDAIYNKVRLEFSVETTVCRQEEIYRKVLERHRKPYAKEGVLVCGAYGNGNLGDETILKSILHQLRLEDPDIPICVMSRRPRETSSHNCVNSIFTFNHLKMVREMKKARLFISGGGSLIQDATSTRSLLFYLNCIRLARKYGCKVMMYGCGIGPVKRERNREKARKIIDRCADLITLRDPDSLKELLSLGVTKPKTQVTADPAITQTVSPAKELLYKEYMEKAGMNAHEKYCLFALRPWGCAWQKTRVFAEAAQYVYEKHGLIPVFFMLEPGKDQTITEAVAEQVHCPHVILPPAVDGEVICAMMRDMKLVVSMRLHALIFAAGQGTPVVGISYDPKVSGFMDYMGQVHCIALETLDKESAEKNIDGALTENEGQAQRLAQLKEIAALNGKLARELLKN